MIRALSITCAVLAFAFGGFGGGVAVANAAPKTIAVLGLEVTGSNITQQDTEAATELTTQLRGRVGVGSSPKYVIAGGSSKELIDEKMIYSCPTMDTACATKMANDMGAIVLMYGSLERKGNQYVVTIKILDTSNTQNNHTQTERVGVADLNGSGVGGPNLARKIYSELTGEASNVQLTLKIQGSDTGVVRINSSPAQPYTSGQITVTVAEGRIKVAVEPNEKGVQRYEDYVNASGQEMSKDIKLEKMTTGPVDGGGDGSATGPGDAVPTHEYGGTVSDGAPGSGWRKTFVLSVVGFGLSGVSLAYGDIEQSNNGGLVSSGGKCTKMGSGFTSDSPSSCAHGDLYAGMANGGGIGLAVFGVLGIVAYYEGYMKHDGNSGKEHAENGHRKHRDRFVVTPVVSPTGAGATVQLDW